MGRRLEKNALKETALPRSAGHVVLEGWNSNWGKRPLTILYLRQSPKSREELYHDLKILKGFAESWDKSDKVLNDVFTH